MISTDNPVPLHIQISTVLEKEVRKGIYEDKIPSERELMKRFSVSRTTIRDAVSKLVSEGTLKKVHGKGTYVLKNAPVQEWLSSLNSFTDTVNKMGFTPGSKLLYLGNTQNPHVEELFGDEDVYKIKRLRYADNTPVAIEEHYYLEELGEGLAKYNLEEATIYNLLEDELKIELFEAEQTISSEILSDENCDHFGIPYHSHGLSVERVISNANHEPIEYYKAFFRPDMYSFRIKTKRV